MTFQVDEILIDMSVYPNPTCVALENIWTSPRPKREYGEFDSFCAVIDKLKNKKAKILKIWFIII